MCPQVLKTLYRDVADGVLKEVYEQCGSRTSFLNWLQHANKWIVSDVSTWAIMRGRCKARGVSGILSHSTKAGPPVVSGKSKQNLANFMRVVRVMCFNLFAGSAPPADPEGFPRTVVQYPFFQ